MGDYLIRELKSIEKIIQVRGRGLMIGFDLPEDKSKVRADLLFGHRILQVKQSKHDKVAAFVALTKLRLIFFSLH
jgi:acetylornithine/succinyldiaminopimelate/putrescine aminotransferase